ncbi:MAG: helix-turn-helix domain-containing protein [Gemmatimonadota bacterium]|nr:helix-turn-helix domain-containing protein [Gemmatimonadota bacterium]
MSIPTREQILAAAARLYAEHGFRGTTTRAVAEAADVNEVTLFRIFGSKEALILEAMRTHGVAAEAHALPDVPQDPEAELTAWATQARKTLLAQRSMIIQAMGDAELNPEMPKCASQGAEAAYDALRAYFVRLRDAGFVPGDADARFAANLLIAALFHDAMSRPVMTAVFPPAAEAAAVYARLTLRAVGFEPRARRARHRVS